MIALDGSHCWQHDDGVLTLREIGASLGRLVRFAGHTEEHYPVLAHALTAAVLCEPKWSIYALFHDAPEAVTNDVPTPWKSDEQKELEHQLYERMCVAYGLPWPIPPEGQAAVDAVDHICLVNEGVYLRHAEPTSLQFKGVAPDERVIDVVQYHHELAMTPVAGHPLPSFFHPKITGPIYEDAFKSYVRKSIEAGLEGVDLERAGLA